MLAIAVILPVEYNSALAQQRSAGQGATLFDVISGRGGRSVSTPAAPAPVYSPAPAPTVQPARSNRGWSFSNPLKKKNAASGNPAAAPSFSEMDTPVYSPQNIQPTPAAAPYNPGVVPAESYNLAPVQSEIQTVPSASSGSSKAAKFVISGGKIAPIPEQIEQLPNDIPPDAVILEPLPTASQTVLSPAGTGRSIIGQDSSANSSAILENDIYPAEESIHSPLPTNKPEPPALISRSPAFENAYVNQPEFRSAPPEPVDIIGPKLESASAVPKNETAAKTNSSPKEKTEMSSAQLRNLPSALGINIDGPKQIEFGKNEIYTITVSNIGGIGRDNVTLRVLPQGFGADKIATQQLGRFLPGEIKTVSMKLNARQYNKLSLSAEIEDSTGASARTEFNIAVTNEAIKIAIVPPMNSPCVGDQSLFLVRITNQSKESVSLNTAVFFAPGIEPVKAVGAPNEVSQGQALFNPPLELNQGEMRDLKITAIASQPGTHKMMVQLIDAFGASYSNHESCVYRPKAVEETTLESEPVSVDLIAPTPEKKDDKSVSDEHQDETNQDESNQDGIVLIEPNSETEEKSADILPPELIPPSETQDESAKKAEAAPEENSEEISSKEQVQPVDTKNPDDIKESEQIPLIEPVQPSKGEDLIMPSFFE